MKEGITARKRTEPIMIRVLPEDHIEIQKLAAQKGVPPATYCYLIIKEAIDKTIAKTA